MYAPLISFHSSDRAGLMLFWPSAVTMVTMPESALSKSSISRNRVVFPAPLLPTKPIMSPLLIVKSEMSTAVLLPNFLQS